MSTAAQRHQEREAGARWRAAFTAVRDVSMTGLALYGVWHQEHTGKVNAWLLLTYVVILGLIPASHAIALAFRAVPAQSPELSRPSSSPVEASGTASGSP